MISEALRTGPAAFDFAKRNRRPPTDPVNALLSFTYLIARARLDGARQLLCGSHSIQG